MLPVDEKKQKMREERSQGEGKDEGVKEKERMRESRMGRKDENQRERERDDVP